MLNFLRQYYPFQYKDQSETTDNNHVEEETEPQEEAEYLEDEQHQTEEEQSNYSKITEMLDQAQHLYSHKNKQSYLVKASQLNQVEIFPYIYQRNIISSHIQNIQNGLQESQMMYHNLILCHIEGDEYTIMDGQHRLYSFKHLPLDLTENLMIQVDVLSFPENSPEIMRHYKYINTNIQIETQQLVQDTAYVELIFELKKAFPNCIVPAKKTTKKNYKPPQHSICEEMLKVELQKKQVLIDYTKDELIQEFQDINDKMSEYVEEHCNMHERKQCYSKQFYLGIQFPLCLHNLKKCHT